MLSRLLTAGAVILVAALMPPSVTADTVTKVCNVGRMKVKISDSFQETASSSYKNMPATAINFVQGSSSGCVVVHFSAEVSVSEETIMWLRAVIDGGDYIAIARDLPVHYNASGGDLHAFNFVFTGIPAGAHRVAIQWWSGGSTPANPLRVFVWNRSTIVQYAP